jgi:hypothetical protein
MLELRILTSQEIDIGCALVRVIRVTCVGELAWGSLWFRQTWRIHWDRCAPAPQKSRGKISHGSHEIDVASVRYPAKASIRPMYDPERQRYVVESLVAGFFQG